MSQINLRKWEPELVDDFNRMRHDIQMVKNPEVSHCHSCDSEDFKDNMKKKSGVWYCKDCEHHADFEETIHDELEVI